jgi:hypothetical protein
VERLNGDDAALLVLHVFGHLVRIQHSRHGELVTSFLVLCLLQLLLALFQVKVGVVVAGDLLKR